jgi:transcriptional regulator with XRE-family HTH domain
MRSSEVIKAARRLRRVTQRQMAAATGVPQSVIARYESGAVSPSLERLQGLLGKLGVQVDVTVKAQGQGRRDNPHSQADARSLGYHRLIAQRLRSDPELLVRTRDRVAGWLSGRLPFAGSTEYARAWQEVLGRPLQEVARVLVAEDEQARELRQNTPFAGTLTPAEIATVIRMTRESRLSTRRS